MNITFLGTGGWLPAVGGDSACLLVDGTHLIDTGWYALERMTELGLDPSGIRSVTFTHLHQDHYLGLPSLLFWFAMKRSYGPAHSKEPLVVSGPAGRVEPVLAAALDFLQVERYPELKLPLDVRPLRPGDTLDLGSHRFETAAAFHTSGKGAREEALSLRIHSASGRYFVYTGDTHPHPSVVDFAKGAPVLIHDAAHTPGAVAATHAKAAGVERLILIHNDRDAQPRALSEAQKVFPRAEYAVEGHTLEV
ncbi:MAG: ribonuclease Z [Spirochaetes bacterium]|nr:ribonuclease Z [Spirochaetota bacterium]